jgi:hypothetical protein
MTSVGFPHSDISGSTPACDSPKLFAANHVLHRLLTPRHPSCALSSLTTNLLWTASSSRRTWARLVPRKLVDGKCHQNFATRRLQGRDRSSTKELGLDGFHRRSFLSKTRFSRHRLFFNFQRSARVVSDSRRKTSNSGSSLAFVKSRGRWSVRGSNP